MFEQYIKHGLYLKGWSPKTAALYRKIYAGFQQSLQGGVPRTDGAEPSCFPTKAQLEAWVIWMKDKGYSAAYINIQIRCINAYLNWCYKEELVDKRVDIKQILSPQRLLRPVSDTEVRLVLTFKPRRRNALRTWALIQLLLDTGLRINEALGIDISRLDMDTLTIRIVGKGNKERVVPFSMELRKVLFRYSQWKVKHGTTSRYWFCTQSGNKLSYRNVYRDIKRICKQAGVEGDHVHPHAFRHKFAVTYIRRGGDLYRLSRILGHSTVSTTEIYLRSMGIAEIAENHSSLSPLSRHF